MKKTTPRSDVNMSMTAATPDQYDNGDVMVWLRAIATPIENPEKRIKDAGNTRIGATVSCSERT